MKAGDQLRKLNKKAGEAAERDRAEKERAANEELESIREKALNAVPRYVERCIAEAKEAAEKDRNCRSKAVILCDFETSDMRDCYIDAALHVAKELTAERLVASHRISENHGRHNCAEVYEYHYQIYIDLSW